VTRTTIDSNGDDIAVSLNNGTGYLFNITFQSQNRGTDFISSWSIVATGTGLGSTTVITRRPTDTGTVAPLDTTNGTSYFIGGQWVLQIVDSTSTTQSFTMDWNASPYNVRQ